MATSINWIMEKRVDDKSKEKTILEKVKKLERERIKSGWKFVQIHHNLQILVPFGKDGKPTKEGLTKIAAVKSSLGIK